MTKEDKVKIIESEKAKIFPGANVKKSIQGNIIEITYTSHRKQGATIKKLNKEQYMVVSSGEIKEYNQEKEGNRTDNIKEVKRSMQKLRAIINTNVYDVSTVRWCTFTYKENMQDHKQVVKDFSAFWKRFKRKYKEFEQLDYIIALEPQERGAWHIHALILFHKKAPFISGYELGDLWQKGFCNVQAIDNVDNVGAYLTAYLTDIEVPQDSEDYDKIKDNKKIKKGSRLSYYPTKMKFYRYTKGIKKPQEEEVFYGDLQELNKCSQTFKKAMEIHYDENDPTKKITIIKEYYNIKRPRQDGDKHYIPKKQTIQEIREEILPPEYLITFNYDEDTEGEGMELYFDNFITTTEREELVEFFS